MEPLTTAALISGGASLLSGIGGALFNRKSNEQNYDAQREFAQHGIQWKVEDAKRAGLHPLFALGGGGATFSPSFQPLMTGQDLHRAASAFADVGARQVQAAQIEALKAGAAKDYATAQAADSLAARHRQEAYQTAVKSGLFTDVGGGTLAANPPGTQSFPVAEYKPFRDLSMELVDAQGNAIQERIADAPNHPYIVNPTGDPGKTFKRWGFPTVGEILLPDANQSSEAFEGLESALGSLGTAYANLHHYGPAKFKFISDWVTSQMRSLNLNPAAWISAAAQALASSRGR